MSENETCFDKDNKKLKEKLISYFNNDLCEEEMFEGERGQCLLLSNQGMFNLDFVRLFTNLNIVF